MGMPNPGLPGRGRCSGQQAMENIFANATQHFFYAATKTFDM